MEVVSERGENPYDGFAEAYAESNESNAWNARYERPAMLALVGDVRGRRVLDAGCGAGALAAALLERRAEVTGVDSSARLLAIASERLGASARLQRADLCERLPFADATFDVVVASLVLHYLRDWGPTLDEFRRVLVGGGRLIISTHHPFMDHILAGGSDYFATYELGERWQTGDSVAEMRFWHRPLGAMTEAIREAGFTLEALTEPQPEPVVRELDPAAWDSLTTEPRFIFFVCEAPGRPTAVADSDDMK